MDLMKLGKQLLGDKLGDNPSGMMEALSGLIGGADGGLDLSSLSAKVKDAGLGGQLSSWLGDGENQAVSGEQMKSLFGEDKVAEVASKLGVDSDAAAESLSQTVPNLLDKASSGGSLLDQVGGLSGVVDKVKKFL